MEAEDAADAVGFTMGAASAAALIDLAADFRGPRAPAAARRAIQLRVRMYVQVAGASLAAAKAESVLAMWTLHFALTPSLYLGLMVACFTLPIPIH